ncbi:MAG: GTPase ObgE [Omnitrophica bacterium]|nr:GTPase ObgE [Candidatus Omnitrophota bacterium]
MLIDQARIHVKAGDGGDGCTSFYRDRAVRKGKPTGGNGGDGGDVIFKVDKNIHTLLDFQYKRHFKAKRGIHGGSNDKRGKNGEAFYIKIPPGTVIKDAKTGFILRDLTHDGEEVIIAQHGRGGRGNTKRGEGVPGSKGEEKELLLELKLIADVGIIGYPNAGKSTLISRISRAKSKVADYTFTTKAPILGKVRCGEEDITFADMPGLIEGAHRGRGLGDEFLRHIERTKILLHMVDIAGFEGRDAYEDYISINNELALYGKHLAEKPQIVAVNKMDISSSKRKFASFEEKIGQKVRIYPISAQTGEGIKALLVRVWEVWKNEV